MKIAIPSSSGKGVEDEIHEHFGKAPFYTIIEVDGGKVINVRAERNPAITHSVGEIPIFLAKMGVSVVISFRMGFKAREIFKSLGIRVITGVKGRISEVLKEFLKGKLEGREYVSGEECRELH